MSRYNMKTKTKKLRNVTDPYLNEYVDLCKLCDALWPYRDYAETKEEFDSLRKRRDEIRKPR